MAETPSHDTAPAETGGAQSDCARCGKPAPLCVCAGITPLDNRIALLILQHPQEQDRELGTARLTILHLQHAQLRIGLSWPSLAKALGRPAESQRAQAKPVDPKRWGVLYLGSAVAKSFPPGRAVVAVDGKGVAVAEQDRALAELDGVIILDGSWSQAKTLWWRNPWVLKCRRLVLNPKQRSRYGALRREPRPESLSTLEAAALALAEIGRQPEIGTALEASFVQLLAAYRALNRPAGLAQSDRSKARFRQN